MAHFLSPIILLLIFGTVQSVDDEKKNVSANSILQMALCFRQFIYSKSPIDLALFEAQARNGNFVAVDESVDVGKMRINQQIMEQLMAPHYRIEAMDSCLDKIGNEISDLAKVFLEKPSLIGLIKGEKGNLKTVFWQIGKRIKGQKKLTFQIWRRWLNTQGMALKGGYLMFAKVLLDKLLESAVEEGTLHGHFVKLVSYLSIEKSIEKSIVMPKEVIATLKWMTARMGDELENNDKILQFTYFKQYLDADELAMIYVAIHKKLSEKVDIDFGTHRAEFSNLAMPKARRVIWAVRDIQFAKNNLQKVFKKVPLKRVYVGKFMNRRNKQHCYFCIETAMDILGRKQQLHPDVVVFHDVQSLSKSFMSGDQQDDGFLPSVKAELEKILDGELEGHGAGGRGKTWAEYKERVEVEEDTRQWQPTGEEEGPANSEETTEEWLAPGEENAEHILLVGELGAIVAMQLIFDGTFQHVPQGSISKFVEIEEKNGLALALEPSTSQWDNSLVHRHGKAPQTSEGKLGHVRMVFASQVKHLSHLAREEDNYYD